MTDHWCALPFSAVTYYADGSVAPCCKYLDRDTSRDFYQVDPKEALRSPMFQSLQRQFTNGEKPEACRKCWNAEDQGLPSFRTDMRDRWPWARPADTPAGAVKMIDVAFGNVCNAACLTCDSVSSQKWNGETSELLKIPGNPFERWLYPAQSHAPEWSIEQVRDIEFALFDQSEPFLQPGFKSLIRRLKDAGALARMSLFLSTNGSYWPSEDVLADLLTAKKLEIQISVDGTDKMFEYLRYPLRWDVVDSTVDRWVKWAGAHGNTRLIGRMTLSALNLLHESKVDKWWHSKYSTPLTHGVVYNPWYLAPMVLSQDLRHSLAQTSVHLRVVKSMSLPDSWHPSYARHSERERIDVLRRFLFGREKARALSLQSVCPQTYDMIFSE